ncbi:MAG: RluA family pseudouridine synthase [Deltaproteobacteria bacterium]|nr:RluA family pseudouridine synthase [Deltaproteobacteria bacterium]
MRVVVAEMDRDFRIVATVGDDGERVDVFLAKHLPQFTRSRIKTLSLTGALKVSGKTARASCRLSAGDVVELSAPEPVASNIKPVKMPLRIIFEDDAIIVIDKPVGVVTHPACGHYDDTLINGVLFHSPTLSGVGGVLRPGVVHRLDKNTSGIIVFAKSDRAHQMLAMQFKERQVEKRYLCLVFGNPSNDVGEIDFPIGRHPRERQRMSASGKRAKGALTIWKVLERLPFCTLLEVEIKTGRTHQIRVHLSASGYPVIGDAVYGKPNFNAVANTAIREALRAFPRQALHSHSLSFVHPISCERVAFSSPLPADIASLRKFLWEQKR